MPREHEGAFYSFRASIDTRTDADRPESECTKMAGIQYETKPLQHAPKNTSSAYVVPYMANAAECHTTASQEVEANRGRLHALGANKRCKSAYMYLWGSRDSHIMVVFGADTRAVLTNEGATKAEAPEAHATAITADFILSAFVEFAGPSASVGDRQGVASQSRTGQKKARRLR